MENRIGDYEVGRQLTRSLMLVKSPKGELFQATVYSTNGLASSEIQRQVDKLLSINHPNVLPVVECISLENDRIAVLEQYCAQGNICDYLTVSYSERLARVNDLACGLHYLHKVQRIAHPNFHIGNIFSKNGRIEIGGIAKFSQLKAVEQDEPTKLAQDSTFDITEEMYGYHSNIRALGIVFLHILLYDNSQSLSYSKESKQQELLESQLCQVTPPFLGDLIRRMINKMGRQRPTTAQILSILNLQEIPCTIPEPLLDKLLRLINDIWHLRLSKAKLKAVEVPVYSEVKRIAETGTDSKAMFIYARMLHQGASCEKNLVEAKKWFLKAVEAGEPRGWCNLFLLEDDNEAAKPLLQRGFELGDLRCKWYIGRGLAFGLYGYEKDQTRASSILQTLPRNYPDAKYDLSRIESSEQGFAVPFPHQFAQKHKEGAKLGHKKAMEAVGECYYEGNSNQSALLYYLIAHITEGEPIANEGSLSNSVGACLYKLKDKLNSRYWFALARGQKNVEASNNMYQLLLF